MRIHNTYSVLYNELVFDLLKKRFGEGEAVVFARSATVGGQRFPVVRVLEMKAPRLHTKKAGKNIALGRRLRIDI